VPDQRRHDATKTAARGGGTRTERGCVGLMMVLPAWVCGFDGGAAGMGVVGFVFRWVLWCWRGCG
jgi:hypothetical protein